MEDGVLAGDGGGAGAVGTNVGLWGDDWLCGFWGV